MYSLTLSLSLPLPTLFLCVFHPCLPLLLFPTVIYDRDKRRQNARKSKLTCTSTVCSVLYCIMLLMEVISCFKEISNCCFPRPSLILSAYPKYAHEFLMVLKYTHTREHAYTHTHIHTYKHTHTYNHTQTHTHNHAHTQSRTHTITHTHTHTQSIIHTHTHTYTHTHTHTHTHAHANTHTIIHTLTVCS